MWGQHMTRGGSVGTVESAFYLDQSGFFILEYKDDKHIWRDFLKEDSFDVYSSSSFQLRHHKTHQHFE